MARKLPLNSVLWERLLLIFLTVALIFPVWYFAYLPTIDGPSHVANAANLLRLISGQCPLVQQFYELTKAPVPNSAGHIFMAISDLLLAARSSEKLLLSLIIIGFCLSIRTHLRPENRGMVIFLILLFALSCVLFNGSYNFLISLCLTLLFLKWWRSNYSFLSRSNFIKLFGIYTSLYFSHLFGYGIFVICIGVSLALDSFLQRRDFKFKKLIHISVFNLLAATPTIIMALFYLSLPKQPIEGMVPLAQKFVYILFPTSLYSFDEFEKLLVFVVCGFIWLILGLTLYRRIAAKSGIRRSDYYLLAAFAFALLIIITPASFAGGWVIEPRLQLFQWLFVIIWFSQNDYSRAVKTAMISLSLLLFITSAVIKLHYLDKYDRILISFAAAQYHIPDNSIIFTQDISPFTIDYKTRQKNVRVPVPNITGYITAQKCVVEVSNFHAAEKNTFPVKYKDYLNPYSELGQFRTISSMPIIPPIINLKSYEKNTGVKINYVILRGNVNYIYDYASNPMINFRKLYDDFMAEIDRNFALDWQSADGLVKIYKAK